MNLLSFLLILSVCGPLWAGESHSATIVSLEGRRAEKSVRALLGNYLTGDWNGGNRPALVVSEDGFLRFWYLVGNIPSSSFRLRLDDVGKKRVEQRKTSNGSAWVETESYLENLSATVVQSITGRTWKSVERQSLTLDGAELVVLHERTYYKRKYRYWGEWIEDTTSFNGRRNTLRQSYRMLKLSSEPISSDAFFAMAASMPATYVRLKRSMSADELAHMVDGEDYEFVSEITGERRPSAEVIELARFLSTRCSDLLHSPDTSERL